MNTVEHKMITSRNTQFDVLRILLTWFVVLGHINYTGYDPARYAGASQFFILNQNKLLSWIYSFHMPAFMFLSGMLFCVTKYDCIDKIAWDKFKKLVVPAYLLQMFVMIPVKVFTGIVTWEKVIEEYNDLYSGVRGGVYDHLWFMMALFWCCLFFYFPCKFLFHRRKIVIGFFACGFLMKYIPMLPFSDDFYLFKTGLTYLFVFALGWVYHKKSIGQKLKTVYKLLYLVCYLFFIANYHSLEVKNRYVIQVAGILAVTFLSEMINHFCKQQEAVEKIIRFYSKETKYVYYFHVPLLWISVAYLRERFIAETVVWYFLLEVAGCMLLPVLGHRMLALLWYILKIKGKEKCPKDLVSGKEEA